MTSIKSKKVLKKQKVERKKKWIAYFLWVIAGFFGFHLLYLRRDLQAFAMWCTAGGGLGLGWIRDLWRIPEYVDDANEDEEYIKKLAIVMKKNKRPPISRARLAGQILLSMALGTVYFWSIPGEKVCNDWNLKFLRFLTPIPVSLGVWIVGNIGRQQGGLKPSLITAFIVYAFSYANMPFNLVFCCIFTTIVFTLKSTEWRRNPAPQHSISRRILILGLPVFIYICLICSGMYFNTGIASDNSEINIKFGLILEKWEALVASLNHYRVHGWWKAYEDYMDPNGEIRSLQILGLAQSATKSEIIVRFRALSKEWHPDRQKDQAKKDESHAKFVEIQGAYQILIQTRGKIQAAKAPHEPTSYKKKNIYM